MPPPVDDELRRQFAEVLIGPIRNLRGIAFAPIERADEATAGSAWRPCSVLADFAPLRQLSAEVWQWTREKIDAVWARARVERLFLLTTPSEDERYEKSCFGQEFVAVGPSHDGLLSATIFRCSDYYASTCLYFAEPIPDANLLERLSDAFWRLLLADSDDVHDYTDQMYHPGVGMMFTIGIRNGVPFIAEVNDNASEEQ